MMASEEVKGSFYRYDFWVITAQLATGAGALERELLIVRPAAGLLNSGKASTGQPVRGSAYEQR